eukprot:gene7466-15278_t
MITSATEIGRRVLHVVSPSKQKEGGGFIVRRPLGNGNELGGLFLLVDHLDYTIPPGVGFPGVMHPHRGFETVGYQLQGTLVHACMSGVEGVMTDGDAQWMTAGRGVVHGGGSEENFKRTGGPIEAFQIWINLPRMHKMVPPRYQDVKAKNIPVVDIPNARPGSTVKVVSGTYNGISGACSTLHPVSFLDIRLQPGDSITLETPTGHVAFAYVYRGSASFGSDGSVMNAGQGSHLSAGESFSVTTNTDAIRVNTPAPHRPQEESFAAAAVSFIFLMGEPINEPVARAGPFVMNTEAELEQCFIDFRSGKMAADSRSKDL